MNAIAKKWKNMPKNNYMDLFSANTDIECEIHIDNIKKPINTVEPKNLCRMLLRNKIKRPTSENKWKENYEREVDENYIFYISAFKLTTDTKIQTLHFKLLI